MNIEEKLYFLGPIFLIVGIFSLIFLTNRIISFGPKLERVGVSALSISGEKGFGGSWLVIEVDGERYRCAGAQALTGPWRGVEVLYDPNNPTHCREASIVGSRPSPSEWIALTFSLQFLAVGTFIVRGLIRSRRRKREEKERLLQELGL